MHLETENQASQRGTPSDIMCMTQQRSAAQHSTAQRSTHLIHSSMRELVDRSTSKLLSG